MTTHRTVRLKVLMHQFYAEGDHRQKAVVILQKSWTTVLQLQQHIQRIFKLPGQIALTVDDGCLLPTDEDINVVTETDSVTVQSVKTSFNLLSEAFSNAHIYSANETTPGAWTSDISSPGIVTRPGPTKRLRTIGNIPVELRVNSPSKCSKWIKDVDLLDVAAASDDQKPDVELSLRPRRQRKRKRKQAKAPQTDADANETNTTTEVKVEQIATVFRAERPPSVKGHIRFDDSDDNVPTRATEPPKNEPFPLPPAARVIRAVCTTAGQMASSSSKVVANVEAPIEPIRVDSVIQTNVVVAPMDQTQEEASTQSTDLSALEKLRRNVADLNLPAVLEPLKEKDMIAFRIMKLSDNYMPGMSEYIVGMVQAIDADAGAVSVHVMAGHDQTEQPQGKFSLADDDTEDVAPDRTFHVNRADMFDVKYVQL